MIDIIGDVIYFDNRPVGVVIVPSGSLRWDFEEALERADALNGLDVELRQLKSTLDEII